LVIQNYKSVHPVFTKLVTTLRKLGVEVVYANLNKLV